MNRMLFRLHQNVQDLANQQEGQDLVEYALIVGVLVTGITASSQFLASSLATAFTTLSTKLGSYVS